MASLWILVADGMAARVFEKTSDGPKLIRRHDNAGSAGSPAESASSYWAVRFARDVAAMLEMGAAGGQYDELIVAATFEFGETLAGQLGPNTLKRLRAGGPENLTRLSDDELLDRLTDF